MSRGRGGTRRWAVNIAKLVLTLAATYFLFRSLGPSWNEIAQLRADEWLPRPSLLIVSLLVVIAGLMYVVWLWARLVRSLRGPRLGLEAAVAIYFISSLGRYIPGKVWQLAGLAYLASRRGVDPGLASLAAVLAQVFSLAAAVAIAALYFLAGGRSALPDQAVLGALALAAGVWAFVSVPPLLRFVVERVTRYRSDVTDAPRLDGWFGLRWLVLHLPAWIAYGLGFALLWEAVPALPPTPWVVAMGSFAAAYVLGYAALFAPAGLGVREGVMALLLAPWMGASSAAVLALLARIWLTAAELLPLAGLGARRAISWVHTRVQAS